jgi:hypothetical protein
MTGTETRPAPQTRTDPQTVLIGVFSDHQQAERYVEDLKRAGFRDDQIGVARRGREEASVEETAAAGALTGGTIGVLAGVAVAVGLIPGIGPVMAGGLLAGILGGAVGASAGGLLGALIGLGISEELARHYESELTAGRTLVVVKAAGRYPDALTILRRHVPV